MSAQLRIVVWASCAAWCGMKKKATRRAPVTNVTMSEPKFMAQWVPRSRWRMARAWSVRLEQPAHTGMPERREDRGQDHDSRRERLRPVLRGDRGELDRLAAQVGARRVELFPQEHEVARADEEGELRHLVGARDLDRAGQVAGLGQEERLRVERSEHDVRGGAVAQHVAGH